MERFTHRESMTKTSVLELIPVGNTRENIEALLLEEKTRVKYAPVIKEVINKMYRIYINQKLKDINLDQDILLNAYYAFSSNDKKTFEEYTILVAKHIKKELAKDRERYIPKAKDFDLKKSNMILTFIEENYSRDEQTKMERILRMFDSYGSYFQDFLDHKDYILESENANSVIYRVIENMRLFFSNCSIFENNMVQLEKAIKENMPDTKYYSPENFNSFLSFDDIISYNIYIAGENGEVGEKRKLGLNELINVYNSRCEKEERIKTFFSKLHLQILQEKTGLFEVIVSEEDLRNNIQRTIDIIEEENYSLIDKIKDLVNISYEEMNGICITKEALADVSKICTGSYTEFNTQIREWATSTFLEPKKTKIAEKKMQAFLEKEEYSINELLSCGCDITPEHIAALAIGIDKEKFNDKILKVNAILAKEENISGDEKKIESIKAWLDATLEIYRLLKKFGTCRVPNRNAKFYELRDSIVSESRELTKKYNLIRNYLTKKISPRDKMKCFFGYSQFGGGWDKDYIATKGIILLRHEEKYFIAIPNAKGDRKRFSKIFLEEVCGGWEYLNFKQLSGANKMLPKCFVASKDAKSKLSAEFLEKYYAGKHTKASKDFDLNFLHEYIDLCKANIAEKTEWKRYNMTFSPTENYGGVDEFYREVEKQGIDMAYLPINERELTEQVEDGNIFLFEMTSRDMRLQDRKVNPNTQRVLNALDEKNFNNILIRLCGGVEIFYREKLLSKTFSHKKGEFLLNKNDKYGNTIPNEVYISLKRHLNNIEENEELFNQWKSKIKFKENKFELTKDRRYCKEAFEVQIPVVMNSSVPRPEISLNTEVKKMMEEEEFNIIAINRGEKELIYLTMTDKTGKNILRQESFNVIDGVDYQDKLVQKADKRENARKSWKDVEGIKDLKEGYLSLVVGKIARLMVENKAILVMEDLTMKFKQKRTAVENSIYQQFEKAIINKLSCCTLKEIKGTEPGSVSNPLQLTRPVSAVGDMKGQNGWIFFVSPAYISRTDYTTGYINLFSINRNVGLTNKDMANLLEKMEDFHYDSGKGEFAFTLDYNKIFPDKEIDRVYTIYSTPECRHVGKRGEIGEDIYIAKEMKRILHSAGIECLDGKDLRGRCINVWKEENKIEILTRLSKLFALVVDPCNSYHGTDEFISPVDGGLRLSEEKIVEKVASTNLARKMATIVRREIKEDYGFIRCNLSLKEWLADIIN